MVAYWRFDDHPSTAAAFLVADGEIYAAITLTTAPSEFEQFVEELFLPAAAVAAFEVHAGG